MAETLKSYAPEGYRTIQPYLMFAKAVEAMAYYKELFNATEKLCMKAENGRVVHAELQFGDSLIMMADENREMEAFAAAHYGGSPVSMMIYVEDCDATYTKAIASGATSLREPADQPHGDRMAGVLDPFGYKWWISQHLSNTRGKEYDAG
jgi:PhnB protein